MCAPDFKGVFCLFLHEHVHVGCPWDIKLGFLLSVKTILYFYRRPTSRRFVLEAGDLITRPRLHTVWDPRQESKAAHKMAEGQVPQRGVPLDQPLLSAGKCQWSYMDLFGCALRKWKRQHVKVAWKFSVSHTVFNEFYVINLYEIYMTNATWNSYVVTVKHVYSDHAYNEMMLITKHLGIPGKHSIYFFINFTLQRSCI